MVVVILVTVSVTIAVEVTLCMLVTICVAVNVYVRVVGVALAQKPLRNMSISCSHRLPKQSVRS